MALLAVESAIDDIAGVGQRGGELAIEIGVVLDDEEAQWLFLRTEQSLAPVDNLAIGGVNCRDGHFAVAREHSQHIDEAVAALAELGPDHIGPLPVLAQNLDGIGERDSAVSGNRGALFELVQAGAVGWRIGRKSRCGKQAEQKNDRG